MEQAPRDQNFVPSILLESSTNPGTVITAKGLESNGRLLVDNSGGGSGTVTSVSVVTANGFAGTVATPTTTPAITLTTTVTGVLKGNGTSISAATNADLPTMTATVGGAVPTPPNNTTTFLRGDGTFAAPAGGGITIGTTTITSGTTTRILYDNAGVVGEYTITGSGTVVAMATSPSFTTPALGVATATSLAIGGATIGSNGLAVTGHLLLEGVTSTGSTGTNLLVFATSPTLTTPVLGVATVTSINKVTITAPATSAILTIADGKTLTVSNTLTFTGTDTSSVAFGTGGTVLYTGSTIPLTVGTTTITSGTNTRILYNNSGVLGEYTLTGSGTVVAMQTAPTFVTSATAPLLIGGSGTTGTQLTLKTTTGNGTTDALAIVGGNNGGTTFATFTTGALTITTSGVFTTGTIELGAASDTTLSRSGAGVLAVEGVVIPSISSTNTLTNKYITPQLQSVADAGGTLTPVSITNDFVVATALSQATTIANPSGSPVQGEKLIIRLKDNGTARALTWGNQYRASSDLALPTTTIISKTMYCGFIYNSTDTKWDFTAFLNNF